jgi:hypothetical protein
LSEQKQELRLFNVPLNNRVMFVTHTSRISVKKVHNSKFCIYYIVLGKQPIIICTLVTSGLCQCVVLKAVLFTVKKRGGKKSFALDNYLRHTQLYIRNLKEFYFLYVVAAYYCHSNSSKALYFCGRLKITYCPIIWHLILKVLAFFVHGPSIIFFFFNCRSEIQDGHHFRTRFKYRALYHEIYNIMNIEKEIILMNTINIFSGDVRNTM